MTGWLLLPAVVTAIAFATAVLVSLGVGRIVRAAARFDPAVRARLLWCTSLLPVFAALVLTAMGFVPTLLFELGMVDDWCLQRQAAAHLACPMHPDTVGLGNAALLLALVSGLMLGGGAAYAAIQFRRARKVLARLEALAEPGRPGVVRVIRSPAAVALSSTWPSERIYVSRGVLDALDPAELDALLAHERAHIERRDTLRLLCARMASFALLPPARRQLLQALELAVEQACDQVAALRAGAVTVASALLKFSRASAMPCRRTSILVSAYDGADIASRVEALLLAQGRRDATPATRFTPWLLAILVPGCWLLHELGEFLLLPLVR